VSILTVNLTFAILNLYIFEIVVSLITVTSGQVSLLLNYTQILLKMQAKMQKKDKKIKRCPLIALQTKII
jgi:hypothetical protein